MMAAVEKRDEGDIRADLDYWKKAKTRNEHARIDIENRGRIIDDEIEALARELAQMGGRGSAPSASQREQRRQSASKGNYGALGSAVLAIIEAEQPITRTRLAEVMEQRRVAINGKNFEYAANNAITRLARREAIESTGDGYVVKSRTRR